MTTSSGGGPHLVYYIISIEKISKLRRLIGDLLGEDKPAGVKDRLLRRKKKGED